MSGGPAQAELEALAADLELPLWRIGYVAEGGEGADKAQKAGQVSLYDGDRAPLPPEFMDQFKGYDHFRAT